MKRVRDSARALLFAIAFFAALTVPSGMASAASDYDGSYQSTALVRSWWSFSGCDPVDMTFDWSSYVLNEAKWPPNTDWSANRTSLLSALNNGSNGAWGVAQFHTAIADVVEIYWTEDASAHLEWSGDGVDVTTTTSGDSIHVIDIACSQKFYGVGGATPVGISATLAHSQKISTSTTWSSFYTQRSLFVHGFDLNEPSGYGGESVRTDQPSAKYVAVGDSFSSGEGNSPFEVGTDKDGVNECHRSPLAYPHLLQSSLNLGPAAFVACGGATTANVTGGQWNEPPQIDALSANTEVVTITIGGNDIPIKEFIRKCVTPIVNLSCDGQAYQDALAGITNNVIPNVRSMLEALNSRLTSLGGNTTVLVVGYPQIVPSVWQYNSPVTCWWLQPDELPAIRTIVGSLNTAIKNEVEAIGGKFKFVSATEADSPFSGHELCRDVSDTVPEYFINYDTAIPEAYTFHPNAQGQGAYANLVTAYLVAHPLS